MCDLLYIQVNHLAKFVLGVVRVDASGKNKFIRRLSFVEIEKERRTSYMDVCNMSYIKNLGDEARREVKA